MMRLPCPPSANGLLKVRACLLPTRGIRMRRGNKAFSLNSEKDEDILLKQLVARFKRVQGRLAEAEETERSVSDADFHQRPLFPDSPVARPLDRHNSSLWNVVVSKEDQVRLAAHGITTLEQLQEAYQDADADLNRPPYPPVQRLRPRLQLAYELYQSIPQKLAIK